VFAVLLSLIPSKAPEAGLVVLSCEALAVPPVSTLPLGLTDELLDDDDDLDELELLDELLDELDEE
jgi:hypothetical protein